MATLSEHALVARAESADASVWPVRPPEDALIDLLHEFDNRYNPRQGGNQ